MNVNFKTFGRVIYFVITVIFIGLVIYFLFVASEKLLGIIFLIISAGLIYGGYNYIGKSHDELMEEMREIMAEAAREPEEAA